jgi:DNA-binding transcriptional ArsR family regulator
MSTIRFLPLDPRLEAGSFLLRLAYRGDSQAAGDMRSAAAYYSRKYGVPIEEFAGLTEAYAYIKSRLEYDEEELLTLFGVCDGLQSSIYEAFLLLARVLGKERVQDLNMRIAVMAKDPDAEPDYDHADISSLLAFAHTLPVSNEARWLFTDSCLHYNEYQARLDLLLDHTEALVREKTDLLQPYADAALSGFSDDPSGGKLFSHLAEAGLKLDCINADVFPFVFQFSGIALFSNIAAASHFGEPEHTFIAYGCLIDRINSCAETERDTAESLLTLLHVLDDKRRLEILTALKSTPLCGQEIVALTGLSAATVSHHMNELASTGMVSIEKQGVKLNYSFNAGRIGELSDLLRKALLE